MMRATSLGHAGILIESEHGSIVCDPWFVPGVLRLVVPVPPQRPARRRPAGAHRGRRLPVRLPPPRRPLGRAVAARPPAPRHRRAAARLPDPRARPQDARRSASPTSSAPIDGEELDLGGLTRRHPRRDEHHRRAGRRLGARRQRRRRRASSTRTTAARPTSTRCAAHGPVDLHWLQYSGAIWYPMVYELPAGELRPLVGPRSTASWPGRCATSSRSAPGPSCRAPARRASSTPSCSTSTSIDGDEPSIFVDQRAFLDRLARLRPPRHPGRPRHDDRGHAGRHRRPPPVPRRRRRRHLHRQGRLPAALPGRLAAVARRAEGGLAARTPTPTCCRRCRRGGSRCWRWPRRVRAAIGAACLLRAGDVEVLIDFPAGEVRPVRRRGRTASASRSTARSSRRSSPSGPSTGATRCSCRAASGPGATASSTSGSTTSSSRCRVERMRRTEAEAVRRLDPPTETEPDIELDGWIVQRRCPHRNADLAVFGEIDGLHADVHAARLALRPRDRPLPHRRRPPDPRAPRCRRGLTTAIGTDAARRDSPAAGARRARSPWTQTGMLIGIRPVSQMKSIACT